MIKSLFIKIKCKYVTKLVNRILNVINANSRIIFIRIKEIILESFRDRDREVENKIKIK